MRPRPSARRGARRKRRSLHTNSLDEALALPTAEAATLALRTQQIIAHESGVASVVDPLGGSYFVEKLTRDLEEEALAYFETIDRMGGMVEAVERGYPQREIAESSYRFQQAVEQREKIIVGVNDFVAPDEKPIGTLYIYGVTGERSSPARDLKRRRATAESAGFAGEGRRPASRRPMPLLIEAVGPTPRSANGDALRDFGLYDEVR